MFSYRARFLRLNANFLFKNFAYAAQSLSPVKKMRGKQSSNLHNNGLSMIFSRNLNQFFRYNLEVKFYLFTWVTFTIQPGFIFWWEFSREIEDIQLAKCSVYAILSKIRTLFASTAETWKLVKIYFNNTYEALDKCLSCS